MSQRLERVEQLIRDEIATMLQREIHDPLIGFVTITDVDVSPDLRFAKVYFSVLGDEETVKNSVKGILRARKYINGRLTERLDLRYIPKLRFVLDETAAKAQRMAELLNREHEQLGDLPPIGPEELIEDVNDDDEDDDWDEDE